MDAEVAGSGVTDIGCGRRELWSYGFAGAMGVLGFGMKGLCRWAGVSGE